MEIFESIMLHGTYFGIRGFDLPIVYPSAESCTLESFITVYSEKSLVIGRFPYGFYLFGGGMGCSIL